MNYEGYEARIFIGIGINLVWLLWLAVVGISIYRTMHETDTELSERFRYENRNVPYVRSWNIRGYTLLALWAIVWVLLTIWYME